MDVSHGQQTELLFPAVPSSPIQPCEQPVLLPHCGGDPSPAAACSWWGPRTAVGLETPRPRRGFQRDHGCSLASSLGVMGAACPEQCGLLSVGPRMRRHLEPSLSSWLTATKT